MGPVPVMVRVPSETDQAMPLSTGTNVMGSPVVWALVMVPVTSWYPGAVME